MSVYFASRNGLVKVGCSRRPDARAAKLGAVLIGVMDGSFAEERSIHQRFSANRVEGEWFRPSSELLAFVATLRPETVGEVLTAGEVAELFKVSLVTVGTWADDGKLPSFRTPGGHRRFHRSDVDTFIAGSKAS